VAPGDYSARSGVLTFPVGTTTQLVTVPVVGDTIDEVVEQFTVSLTNPSGATLLSGQGTGTITDNDPLPSLSINNVTVNEAATNATFTVTLSLASSQIVTVNYATTAATATESADYTRVSSILTFPAGTRTLQILVPIIDDPLDENGETFTVNLSGASGATIGTAVGTGTITDNDATPSLTIDNVPVTEGNAGSTLATFAVTLSALSGRQVTVNYATANNTATAASGDAARRSDTKPRRVSRLAGLRMAALIRTAAAATGDPAPWRERPPSGRASPARPDSKCRARIPP